MSLSDFFSAWQFHVATINGLPQVDVYGIPLAILSFTALLIPAFYLLIRYKFKLDLIHLSMIKIVLALWFILCSFYFFQRLLQARAEYAAFSDKSLNQMHEITTAAGYSGFIEFIKRNVPQDEGVMVFLPPGADYFNQKTEYYLYPWRIAHDSRYLAVFHADQTALFNEQKKTFTYKGFDGKEVILSPVRRIAAYKQEEELYYANR